MGEKMAIITCPYCKREIPLDEVLTHQIREKLQREFNEEMGERERDLQKRMEQISQREKEVVRLKRKQEEDMEELRASLNQEFKKKLAEEEKKIEQEAKKKAEAEARAELEDMKGQLEEKTKQARELKDRELQLLKEKQKVEEEKQDLGLKVAREIEKERERIRQEAVKRTYEEHRLKDMEKEKLIEDMKTQIEDLKRKVEQGSQQRQGEVLELELEELLRTSFPYDEIVPVPKGMRGADVIQRVCTPSLKSCGTIIWESKRTKAWSDGWIEKLKEDQREAKADIAAIISTVMPKGTSGILGRDGVWVTDEKLAVGLAMVLREGLIQMATTKAGMVGKNEKMEMLYQYLAGPEFRQQIDGIVEAFASMTKDLNAEKRAMEKIWAKREKQIEKVIRNTSRMYGSMQGIIGSTLPEVEALDIKALSDSNE